MPEVVIVGSELLAGKIHHQYESVLVLGEAFQSYANIKSIANSLDGRDTNFRDAFLEFLGETMLPEHFSELHRLIPESLEIGPLQLLTLFELNIFSRHREMARLIQLFFACQYILDNFGDHSVHLVNLNPAEVKFLRHHLAGLEILVRSDISSRLEAARGTSLAFTEILKSWVLIISLVLRVPIRNKQHASSSGGSLIVQPWLKSKGVSEGSVWGPYWRDFSKISHLAKTPVSTIYLQAGKIRDRWGQGIRLWSLRELYRVVLSVFSIHLRAVFTFRRTIANLNRIPGPAATNYLVLKSSLIRAILGPSLVQGLWDSFLFSKYFARHKPSFIFYLHENQPWERSMLMQLKRLNPNSNTFGLVHTAVRPWDLRYFPPREWIGRGETYRQDYPMYLLVTSQLCEARLKSHWAHNQTIRLVETLRYPAYPGFHNANHDATFALTYSDDENRVVLELFKALSSTAGQSFDIRVQPHPLKRVGRVRTVRTLRQSVPRIFISDSTTTAVIEALELGCEVISVRCGELPNMSPLADQLNSEITFSTARSDVLEKVVAKLQNPSPLRPRNYYLRDESFARWREVLDDVL